jgi:autotransporter-associated beta strand protein/ELWxxDGT repeat protein
MKGRPVSFHQESRKTENRCQKTRITGYCGLNRNLHFKKLGLEVLEDRRLLSLAASDDPFAAADFLQQQLASNAVIDDVSPPAGDSRISPELLTLYECAANNPDVQIQNDGMIFDGSGRIGVRITAADVSALIPSLSSAGFVAVSTYPELHFAEGFLPVICIPELEGLSAEGLLGVLPLYRPVTAVGAATSQADYILEASRVRATLPRGYDGTGITIGILSDSFNVKGGAATDVTKNDLPAAGVNLVPVTIGSDTYNDGPATGTDEGRAMAQLVHDIAPGASLAFSSASYGEAAFAQSIRDLADPAKGNAKIIVDDVCYFTEPFFQDGLVAQAVNDVVANRGVAYFAAAGNQANNAYESSAVQTIPAASGVWYDFDPSGVRALDQLMVIRNGEYIKLCLQWDDPFYTVSGVDTNVDMYLYSVDPVTYKINPNPVAKAETNNISSQTPAEMLGYQNRQSDTGTTIFTLRLKITGQIPGRIKWVNYGNTSGYVGYATKSPTVVQHAGAVNAEAVAAAAYYFQTAGDSYSSQGPTTILFSTTGQRLAQPQVRQTPRITSIDCTDTTFFGSDNDINGLPNFPGTSAAAPHAAAVAALVLQANPSFTPSQIYTRLEATATDIGASGFDNVTGYGLINAYDAVFGPAIPTSLPASNSTANGALSSAWETHSTAAGRVWDYSASNFLVLDNACNNVKIGTQYYVFWSRNEAILHVNMTGATGVKLNFSVFDYGETDHPMSAAFTGSENSDGVALSIDGINWYRLISLTGDATVYAQWKSQTLDISSIAAGLGLTLGSDVRIKFQQYDKYSKGYAGFSFYDIRVLPSPVIALPGPTQTYAEGGPPVLIDSGAVVNDPASTNYDPWTLTVSRTGSGHLKDRLAIRHQGNAAGQIGISGNQIRYGGTIIGTFAGGVGSAPLVIDFAANVGWSAVEALLRNLTFDNYSNNPGPETRVVRIVLQETGGSGYVEATKNIEVTNINEAPVLDSSGSPQLSGIVEDPVDDPGTLVSAIIASGAGGDPIQDIDEGALAGIAVVAVDNTNGIWQWSTNNVFTWLAFGSPTADSARLLASDAQTRIRFVPTPNWSGNVPQGITFCAWDQTSGVNGGTADATINGGNSAFSVEPENASIVVDSVNDPPVLVANKPLKATLRGTTLITSDFLRAIDDESPPTEIAYLLTSVPANGQLLLAGSPLSNGDAFAQADVDNAQLVYENLSQTPGHVDGFTFICKDAQGLAGGSASLFMNIVSHLTKMADIAQDSGINQRSVVLNGQLYFVYDRTLPAKLFKYDRVNDLLSPLGDIEATSGNSTYFAAASNKVYIGQGRRLYEYDPLSDSLTLVVRFEEPPEPSIVNIVELYEVDNRVMFTTQVYTTQSTFTLYEYDPATRGLVNCGAALARHFEKINNTWYCVARIATGSFLCEYEPTSRVLTPLILSAESFLLSLNGIIYVERTLPVGDSYDWFLYQYNTATQQDGPVVDIGHSQVTFASVCDGDVYLSLRAYNPDLGRELYRCDLASGELSLVADILPGTAGSRPDGLMSFHDRLFFSAVAYDDQGYVHINAHEYNPRTNTNSILDIYGLGFVIMDDCLYYFGSDFQEHLALWRIADNEPLAVGGMVSGQMLDDTEVICPFASVNIADPDASVGPIHVTISVDIPDAGEFTAESVANSGFVESSRGVYSYVGSTASAEAAIRALAYCPARNRVGPAQTETNVFTVTVDDLWNEPIVDGTTTVISMSLNDPPTGIWLSNSLVSEDVTNGTVVGTFNTADIDVSDEHTYTLINDPTGRFAISSNDLILNDALMLASGEYLLIVRTTDSGDLTFEREVKVTVANLPPVSAITGATQGVRGQQLHFIITASDAAFDAIAGFSYYIDWGDDSATTIDAIANNGAGVSVNHTFRKKGDYIVNVSAVDRDGDIGASASVSVVISQTLLSDGHLFVGGTSDNDTIEIKPGSAQVHLNGVLIGSFDPTGTITIFGCEGDDTIVVDAAITLTTELFGQEGNDSLTGGGGTNRLDGGEGDDLLIDAGGTNTILSSAGSDEFVAGSGINTFEGTLGEIVPLVFAESYQAAEGETLSVPAPGVLGNDVDPLGFGLFAILYQSPEHGVLSFQSDGSFTYTPLSSFAGTDSFQYRASNGTESPLVTVFITTIAIGPPVRIAGAIADQSVDDKSFISPFGAVTVTDTRAPPASVVAVITLDDPGKGEFTAESLAASGFIILSPGSYRFEGMAASAETAIRMLVFDPAENRVPAGDTEITTFNIEVAGLTGLSMLDATTTVISLSINDPPTDIALAEASVPEDQPVGSTLGHLNTSDPDPGSSFTYSLVAGVGDTDNGSFIIADGQLRANATFDFETRSTYSIRVRSTDQGGLSVEKPFTIVITDVNLPPTDVSLASTAVAENQAAGAVVGSFSTADSESPAEPFSYSLVSGAGDTDNGYFTIDSNGQLLTAAQFDYETKSEYFIRVQTADAGGMSFQKQFAISVLDVNDPPTDLSLSNARVAENQPAGTVIGNFSTTDENLPGDSHSYSLVVGEGGGDNAKFVIEGNTLKTAVPLNFDSQTTYSIRIRTIDAGGLWYEKPLTILPLTATWDGGLSGTGTSWQDPVNWVGDVPPTSSDDVKIGTAFANIAIVSNDNVTIRKLASAAAIHVAGGNFQIAADSTITKALTVDSGAALDLNNYILAAGSLSGSGNVILGSGTLTTGSDNTDTTFSGSIGGDGGLAKTGTGLWTLSGTNSYAGSTVVMGPGILRVSSIGALGSTAGKTTVTSGGWILISENLAVAEPMDVLSGGVTLADGATLAGAVTLAGRINGRVGSAVTGSITLTGNNARITMLSSPGTFTIAGAILDGGAGYGIEFYLTGSAEVIVVSNADSAYGGATRINGIGRLMLGASEVIPDGSAVVISSQNVLDLHGFSETIGSLSGAGSVTLGGGTLTTGGDNTSTTFSGTFSGSGGLVKKGTGSFIMEGGTSINDTTTTVESGVLTVSSIICDSLIIGSPPGATYNSLTVVPANDARTQTAQVPQSHTDDHSTLTVGANAPIASSSIDNRAIAEEPKIVRASEASVARNPSTSAPRTTDIPRIAASTMSVAIQAISTPEITSTVQFIAQSELQNSESINAGRLSEKLLAGAFYADLNSRTRFDNQQLFSSPSSLLSARLKDSVYGELADSLARTKKQPSVAVATSQNAHSLAMRSLVKEYQHILTEPEETALLVSKHFRKQDTLPKKAVDKFHAELVEAIE